MNTRITLFICLVSFSTSLFSQLKGNSYQFPERFSKNYFFDPGTTYLKLDSIQVESKKRAKFNSFKINSTYNFQRNFDNNSMYLEWYELENYLNNLIDTILPSDLKSAVPYRVYIKRNTTVFAEIPKTGIVFISIGMINECKSESEMAYVLARLIGGNHFNKQLMYNSEIVTADLMSAFTNNHALNALNNYNENEQSVSTNDFHADSFSLKCLEKAGLNTRMIKPYDYIQYESDTDISYIKKSGSKSFNSSKASYISGFAKQGLNNTYVKRKKKSKPARSFVIDSTYFCKLLKIASDECLKINFESANYRSCLYGAFKKYLLGDNSLKNLYYIMESARRHMYANPGVENKGFLAEDFVFTEFEYNNYSILFKPEMLFSDSLEYIKASAHPLIASAEQPFSTYNDAYLYFAQIAEDKGFNEALFSKALYYYFKKDDEKVSEHIVAYLKKGGGIFNDLATNLNDFTFPLKKDGKTLMLIDNVSNFSRKDNYFHSLQRISSNPGIYALFKNDTAKIRLCLMNELLGIQPKKLYEFQKIKWHLDDLYTDNDEEYFYKKGYQSKEDMEERAKRNKYNKNLLIYAPELYTWFLENNINGILYEKIKYEYPYVSASEEYHNFYNMGYFNFFDNRPFFGKCIRSGSIRKQKTEEMVKDAREYLFYKE